MSKFCFRSTLFLTVVALSIFIITPHCKKRPPETLNLTLIYSANLNGEIDPCGCFLNPLGGLAYRGAIVNKIRDENKHVLLLDGGNTFFKHHNLKKATSPERIKRFKKSAPYIVDVMNYWKLTAATFGANDLGAGYDEWVKLQKKARYPLLSINAKDEDKIIRPFIIKKINSVKVLITGVTGEVMVAPLFTTDKIKISDHRKPLASLIKKENADLVIVLSHSSYLDDWQLSGEVSGIDIILGAYNQGFRAAPIKNGVPIVHTGRGGQSIAKIDITMTLDKKTGHYSKKIMTEFIEIDPELTPDPDVAKILTEK